MSARHMERREFLRFSVAASGGLLIGLYLPGASKLAFGEERSGSAFMPNASARFDRSRIGECCDSGVDSAHLLSSRTNTAGTFQSCARFNASWNDPWLIHECAGLVATIHRPRIRPLRICSTIRS